MTGRRGFSLVEMVIVLVLAGIVSTAAITMFSTQNRLNAAMTALGESQENARSAVQLAAAELRSATGGSVVSATATQLAVRIPIVIGVICAVQPGNNTHVYFPMDVSAMNMRRDADGKAHLSQNGEWHWRNLGGADGYRPTSRQACIANGAGQVGTDENYAMVRATDPVGSPIMLYREVVYSFAPSSLDDTRRAFYRTRGSERVELAQGFSSTSQFEYRLLSDTVWRSSVANGQVGDIASIRLNVAVEGEGSSGSATADAHFSLQREIQLRGAR